MNLNENDLQRFWNKVKKTDDCWLWTASVNGRDDVKYGSFYFDGKDRKAHIVSYILAHGPVPQGKQINHKEEICPNKHCINPDHLYAGTPSENTFDTVKTGKHNNARKTHCPKGHEYNEENTYHNSGRRYCKECKRISNRIKRARQKCPKELN